MESTGRGTGETRWKVTDRRNGGEARDRDAGEPVKVLVAGGTGVTGRLVRGMLGAVDGIELAYTSRKKPDDGPGRHFPLRIAAGHNEICRVFPQTRLGGQLHRPVRGARRLTRPCLH